MLFGFDIGGVLVEFGVLGEISLPRTRVLGVGWRFWFGFSYLV